jgi:lysozyme
MTKQTDFINSVKQGAIQGWKDHKILPSLTIAQAILESGWGDSSLAQNAHNLFGIKAIGGWNGATYTAPTKEFIQNKWISINAKFRKYNNMNESILDHVAFLVHNPRYANLFGVTDFIQETNNIQGDGYATDPHYATLLQGIIKQYNLTAIDKEAMTPVAKPAPKATPRPSTYTVKAGDTLTAIAQKQGTTIASLVSLNKIPNPSVIKIGQVLRIR